MSESLPLPSGPPTEILAREMRDRARDMFGHALSECSIPRVFSKQVLYDRGEVSLGNDVYAMGAFSRTLVVSIGKAGHTMAEALANTVGNRFTGIIACPNAPPITCWDGCANYAEAYRVRASSRGARSR